MSTKIQSEVQQVNLYDVGRQAYLIGHDFWGIKALRPRRVFIACPLHDQDGIFWKKKDFGRHERLEQLTLRIDARPSEWSQLEKEAAPERFIKKRGGETLELVDAESNKAGSWNGLDKKGKHVKWHSMTSVWRVESS